MIHILIADDHKIFRKGLKQVIDDTPGMQVVDEAANGNEVLGLLSRKHYDVIILDLSMPGANGLEILKRIKADNPSTPVLVLSMHPEEQYALRVMKAGAAGYLTKESDEEAIVAAIGKASRGGKYVTPSLAEKLAFAWEADPQQPVHELLSDREYEVMLLIARGNGISDISKKLGLGVSTISTYRGRILEKTGLKNNAEITHHAIKNRLIE